MQSFINNAASSNVVVDRQDRVNVAGVAKLRLHHLRLFTAHTRTRATGALEAAYSELATKRAPAITAPQGVIGGRRPSSCRRSRRSHGSWRMRPCAAPLASLARA